jgi:predicted RNA binding protein YcfA (HicA-like mRNA interferase family)
MGEKLPVVTCKDAVNFFIKHGCELKRIKGSHYILKSSFNGMVFVVHKSP